MVIVDMQAVVLVVAVSALPFGEEHAHNSQQAPHGIVALRTGPVVFFLRVGLRFLRLLCAGQKCVCESYRGGGQDFQRPSAL